jgi:hypothetical protein
MQMGAAQTCIIVRHFICVKDNSTVFIPRFLVVFAAALLIGGALAAPRPAGAQPDIIPAQTVEGRIIAGDENASAYSFNAKTRDIIQFSLTSTLPGTQIEILDDRGFLLNIGYGDGLGGASLVFIVHYDGEYIVRVVNYERGEGSYRLTMSPVSVHPLIPGVAVSTRLAGQTAYYQFYSQRDQLFSLSASSADRLEIRFDVLDPDGDQVAYGFPEAGMDAVVPRLLARDEGIYTVLLYSPANGAAGDVRLRLEALQPLALDNGPQSIVLTSALRAEVLSVSLNRSTRYRLSVTLAENSGSADVNVFVFQGDTLIARMAVRASEMHAASVEFTPRTVEGLALVTAQDYAFEKETRFTLAIEPLP